MPTGRKNKKTGLLGKLFGGLLRGFKKRSKKRTKSGPWDTRKGKGWQY